MARGQDRLKEYQALSPRLKVEFVDPVQSPAKAQAYDVRGPWPILVVEKGDKRERVSNDGEQDITNALIKVTREGKKTVCLLEGEGERSGEESGDRGFSGAKALAHQEPLRRQERLPDAREDRSRRLHGARGRRPGEGPPARDDRRHPRLREEGRQGPRDGRAGAQGALPEPRRAPQGLEHRGGQRRGGGRLGDGPALRLLRARPARHRVPLAPDHQGLPPARRSTAGRAASRRARARSRASPPRTS